MRHLQLTFCLLIGAAALVSCAVDEPCDSTTVYKNQLCLPATAPTPGPDAGMDAAAATFGTPCTDGVNHSECTGEVNACLIAPGQTMGFCSAAYCDSQPGICPAGWSCLDLSTIVPGAPWGCVPL